MRKLLFVLLTVFVLAASGCKPPEKVVDETPRELTDGDRMYLHSRGLRPEEYGGKKARAYLHQRDVAQEQVKEAQKRQYERTLEKQKKLEAEQKKRR